jgi:hypothetical protein
MFDSVLTTAGTLPIRFARSRRVELRVPVHLRQDGREWFAVATVVNRGGGLVRSALPCAADSRLRVMNTETGETAPFRVVWCREYAPGRHEMGVALVHPCPFYWGATYESLLSDS